MPKIRIYFEKKIVKDHKILLDSKQTHYLKNVMRKRTGDSIIAFNSNYEWECKLDLKVEKSIIPINLLRKKIIFPDIWLCFALIKIKNMNYLVEKISEIGIKKIVPIFSEFSSRIQININRFKKISIEAVEQSDSLALPEISHPVSLKELLKNWDNDRIIFFCDEMGGNQILSAKKIIKEYKKFAIFIGPVGGWSLSDRNLFKGKKIYKLSLGRNILKADTAAIYSLSCMRALLE